MLSSVVGRRFYLRCVWEGFGLLTGQGCLQWHLRMYKELEKLDFGLEHP